VKQAVKHLHREVSIYARAWVRACTLVLVFSLAPLFAKESKNSRSLHEIEGLKGPEAKTHLKDADPKSREAAALAIGRDKESNGFAADLLNTAKTDTDLSVRTAAIQSLGSHQSNFADLTALLNSASEPLPVREAAASALALFPTEYAVQALGQAYNQNQDELKEHLKLCLSGLRSRSPELVQSILGDSDEK
jgi:hypothetical protein